MTTLTQAEIICRKARANDGILTPTKTLMLVEFAERYLDLERRIDKGLRYTRDEINKQANSRDYAE